MEFNGVKVALYCEGELIVIQRDDKPGLRYTGMWDFPGGGREGKETPVETAQREIQEELGIAIPDAGFTYQREYPSMDYPDQRAFFLVAKISKSDVDKIVFGNEGQGWDFMSPTNVLERTDVVPGMKGRLQDYLDSNLQ